MARLKFLFLTVTLLHLGFFPLFAQVISPDRRWEIRMTFKSSPDPSAVVSAIRSSDKTSQVLFEHEYNSKPGPELSDLKAIKWTKDSKAFFIPIHGRRYEGFVVYVLKGGRWKEAERDYPPSQEEKKLRSEVTGDERICVEVAKAWTSQNVLEWTFSREGRNPATGQATFYHRIEEGPDGLNLKFLSGKIETTQK